MFYFDYTPKNVHYGTIRQQIWALLHFPFHLAIVLSVEGLRQLTTAYSFQFTALWLVSLFGPSDVDGTFTVEQLAAQFNATFLMFYEDGNAKSVLKDWDQIEAEVAQLDTFGDLASDNTDKFYALIDTLVSRLLNGLADYLGIKVPYKKYKSPADQLEATSEVFDLVYQYFFISLGVIFVMYSIFAILVRRQMDIFDILSVVLRFCLAIVFFGMVGLRSNDNAYANYTSSPWPVPQACLMIFVSKFFSHSMIVRVPGTN